MTTKERLIAYFVLPVSCTIYADNVAALWSGAPTVNNPICTAVNYQQDPSIISDGSGGSIITWMDLRNGNWDIYAQRINADGVVQWTADGVPICTEPHDQNNSTSASHNRSVMVSDGSGGAIITWWDTRAGRSDIYAQRINASGVVQWATDGVPICTISASLQNYQIAIVGDGNGGAIITWADLRNWHNEDKIYDIYAQRINANGVVQWATDGVPISNAIYDQNFPDIISDGNGGAIITWQDDRSSPTPSPWGSVDVYTDIYAQRINANGAVQWIPDGVPICTATNFQYQPLVVSDGNGGAIITWQDSRNGVYGDANAITDIYAQRVNGSGVVQWATNGVPVCTAPNHQMFPEIASDGSGGAFITWHDARTGVYHVYAQRINAAGVAQWKQDGVAVSTAPNGQYNPKITSTGNSGLIITWWDLRSGFDIYAQRINGDGMAEWTPNGIPISVEANNQYPPTNITSDGNDGAIITWYDDRNGNWDIYAQWVNADGTFPFIKGDVNLDGSVGLADAIVSLQIATSLTPNPINPAAEVNGDGKIGVPEAIYVIRKVAGL